MLKFKTFSFPLLAKLPLYSWFGKSNGNLSTATLFTHFFLCKSQLWGSCVCDAGLDEIGNILHTLAVVTCADQLSNYYLSSEIPLIQICKAWNITLFKLDENP